MKTTHRQRPSRPGAERMLAALRTRLANAEAALRAIRAGEVDSVVVAGSRGPRVFTLAGAEHAYRVLIETMNEGALALTVDKLILYANRRFARMVKCPLERVIGSSLRRFLSTEDGAKLKLHLRGIRRSGAKFQVTLLASDGSKMPVQVSIRPMAGNSPRHRTVGVVITDMTEARRSEELLRALTKRVVRIQEAERGRVAFELHDNITQLICAVLFRSQALADNLSPRDGTSKKEAVRLRAMLGKTAAEVERISHKLGPTVLDNLGLATALGDAGTHFAKRTGVPVKLAIMELTARMPAGTELALYRILQEALRNVEKHASARHVTVRLSRIGSFVRLAIRDDGIGFEPNLRPSGRKGKGGLGLLGMRERAGYVGATFKITSARREGTAIEVLVPVMAESAAPGGAESTPMALPQARH